MNDILKPEVVWIEGRCYRLNDPSTTDITSLQEHDLYENEVPYADLECDEEDDDFEVFRVDDNRYTTSFHVSKHYIGYIIGKKGSVKMRIERDTRTEIKIPKQGQTGDIIIFGPSTANVKTARRRLEIIVTSSRMKQKPTHFVSVPLKSSEILTNFEIFKKSVLNESPSRGIDESLFIRGEKLHLTIGVMCLMDNEERLVASKLLTEAKSKVMSVLQGRLPLKIRLKGLSYMNDDPSQIDVLYGRVQEEGDSIGLIQKVADSLFEHFHKAGFMFEEFGRDNVKLHVTLINSKYRKRTPGSNTDDSQNSNSSRNRETFDGSLILSRFGDYDFGVTELTHIHLSQRRSVGADGYYQATCIITCENDN